MPRAPTVSVIVPAYNHERFVGEAIASATSQTWQDLEIVVVDDCSTDSTAEVAASLAAKDPRIRVVRQANAGSHGAINRGIDESSAPWIAILNSDDRFAPDRIERLVAFASDRHDFVVGDARLIDADGAEITDPTHWWLRTMADFHAKVDQWGAFEGLLYGNYTVSTSNFLFRRSLVEAIGPLRPLRHVIDWEFALRAAQHDPARFGYLRGERLLDYRLHGSNAILSDTLRGAIEMKRVQREVLERLGVPAAMISSLHRVQRELRRAWRDRSVRVAEGFVRDREADVATLQAGVATLQADAAALQAALEQAAQVLRARDAELVQIKSSLAWRVLSRLGLIGSR